MDVGQREIRLGGDVWTETVACVVWRYVLGDIRRSARVEVCADVGMILVALRTVAGWRAADQGAGGAVAKRVARVEDVAVFFEVLEDVASR